MTRGRLPSSVYWRRRLVLLTVVGLVFIVGLKVVGHLGGGSDDGTQANLTSNTGQTTDPDDGTETIDVESDGTTDPAISPGTSDSPLPEPSGDCEPTDLVVSPTVGAVGSDGAIGLTLALHTMDTPACNWQVSDHTMQVKITTRGKTVWSTADCPKAMPDQSVVVYRDTTTPVTMTWSGRFSSPGCPSHERWASYGNYTATAAIFGGEPGDDKFSLVAPSEATPPSPSEGASSSAGASDSASPSGKASGKASDSPSDKPSGKPSKQH